MSQTPQSLLQQFLQRRLDAPRQAWLTEQVAACAAGIDDAALDIAFGMVPRKLGHAELALDDTELAAAAQALDAWDPRGWTLSDAARILLLTSLKPGDKPFAARFRRLCETADAVELVTLYRGLPLYPEPASLEAQAGEGLRSNMRVVFEAIAHRNPYPRRQFDENRWNQMLVKALFIGSTLAPVQGLDARANADLARILIDFSHERRAAGRPIPYEIWRCVGPFANGTVLDDMARIMREGSAVEQRAAALGLASCPDPRAASLLQQAPQLLSDIESKRLSWASLQAA